MTPPTSKPQSRRSGERPDVLARRLTQLVHKRKNRYAAASEIAPELRLWAAQIAVFGDMRKQE
ncbi:hypothetical protein Oter_1177 [Opitutus terrae PB90-1]|uniref:Uncharacterized protein n=1 Tax=Opitutus terrae (strain DSM 11246 / JCM 15787 / PB90-1) TaxID=452637 RepID=B1ZNN4_OPITP|nr:hypothetical protein Oter_1177 [Opitutus terrae PB90-1]